MSKRFAWLLGVVVLVSIGLLVACGTKYSSSSDGLVIVGSQGSNLIQSFSFNLSNGHIAGISSPPATPATPSAMVLDPAGAYAYAIVTVTGGFQCGSGSTVAGIQSFKVNSSGTMTAGDCTPDPNPTVFPAALSMDAAGKFLFVAEGLGGGVTSYAINGGSLTAVPGTFTFVNGSGFQTPNFVALAASPTVFPAQNAVCSTSAGNNPPSSEFLYVADSVNNVVWEFSVDPSSGALGNPGLDHVPSFPADSVPSGVAVDPCDRFVYVSNTQSNRISAYTICNGLTTQSSSCPATPDGSLVPVSGSPFSLPGGANGPGPMLVDPFGNYLYVVDTLSNMVSPFHISPVSGSLTSQAVVATGRQPKAIAIRSDDLWLFVSNFQDGTLSQYSIIPATGTLTPLPATTTDNYPFGVAVK